MPCGLAEERLGTPRCSRKLGVLTGLLILILVGVAGPASAEDSQVDPLVVARAQKRAVEARERGDWELAYSNARAVLELDPTARTFGSRLIIFQYLNRSEDWGLLRREARAALEIEGLSEQELAQIVATQDLAQTRLLEARTRVRRHVGIGAGAAGGATMAVGLGFLFQGVHISAQVSPEMAGGWFAAGSGILAGGAVLGGVGIALSVSGRRGGTVEIALVPAGGFLLVGRF